MDVLYIHKRAELVLMLLFMVILILILSLASGYSNIMFGQLIMALIYVYSKKVSKITKFWALQLSTEYLPIFKLVVDIISGGLIVPTIIGIIVGHCYYFLKILCVKKYRRDYLPTPFFLYTYK